MTALATTPASFQMASTETLPLAFSTTNLLGAGETPSAPTAALVELVSGRSYAAGLSGSPSVSGNTVTQSVTALEPGKRYRLNVTFTAASGKVWTMETILDCVY